MIKDFCDILNLITLVWLCFIDNYLLSLITRWLYFSKIWFILKELMQNQALFDMFHVLRNEGHYFRHIFFPIKFKGSTFSTIFGSYAKSFLIHKLFAICSTHSETNIGMNSITMIVFQQNLVHIKRAYAKPSSFGYVPCFTKWRTLFSTYFFPTKFKGSKFSTIFGSYAKSFLIHKLFAICSTHSETNIHMNSITMIVFQQNLVHIKRAYAKPSSLWYVPSFTKWRTLFSTYFFSD